MKKALFLSSIFFITLFACKSKKETASTPAPAPLNCSSSEVSFEKDIKPIMIASCTNCHGAKNPADGLNFLTIESTKKAGAKGELLGTVKHEKGYPKMPINASKLDQTSIDKIECWIANGMKD